MMQRGPRPRLAASLAVALLPCLSACLSARITGATTASSTGLAISTSTAGSAATSSTGGSTTIGSSASSTTGGSVSGGTTSGGATTGSSTGAPPVSTLAGGGADNYTCADAGFDSPNDIRLGPDGSVYVLSDQVYQVDAIGNISIVVPSAVLSGVDQIALAPDGGFFLSAYNDPYLVDQIYLVQNGVALLFAGNGGACAASPTAGSVSTVWAGCLWTRTAT